MPKSRRSGRRARNRERFITNGLWRYSRHHNYFGEMLFYWGPFVFAVPFLHGAAFAVVIGPICITLLLLFVSGIPLLERSAEAKYDYREYKRRTNILVPLPPRRNAGQLKAPLARLVSLCRGEPPSFSTEMSTAA